MATGERVLLQTATVLVQSSDGLKSATVKVLFDSASHRTFMTDKLAKRLQLSSQCKEVLSVSTFAAKRPQDVDTYVVQFSLMTKDEISLPLQANVINQITGPIYRGPLQSSDLDFLLSIPTEKMADTIPKNMEPSTVDLLIGSDYFWTIVGTDKMILPSGLFLVSSKIGYILTGSYLDPMNKQQSGQQLVTSCSVLTQVNQVVKVLNLFSCTDDSFNKTPNLEDFWELETIGIRDPLTLTDDDKALAKFNESICFKDGRYQVQWPWKCENPDLPENFDVVMSRFKSLERRLQRNKDLMRKCDDVIQNQVKQGIIERVLDTTEGRNLKHYLSHHPVLTPAKHTTKLRVVYDASLKAKKGDNSLNDCLYRGPILLPDLCGMLLHLRQYPIVILADIEKAFLQVGIQEKDRDVTRFLWFKDPNNIGNIQRNLEIYRFCRIPFGIVCSPFLLSATIKFHLNQYGTSLASYIRENIYVDNIMLGATSVKEAFEIYVESKKIFQEASMNLREWMSNSNEFLSLLSKAEVSGGNMMKIFGIQWNHQCDVLQIKGIDTCDCTVVPTKREALKTVAKIFDPLGLITPVIFWGKVFLQELWKKGVTWDEPLSSELAKRWHDIVQGLLSISTLKIPRYVSCFGDNLDCYLLVFCDASIKAYATAIYLRVQNQNGVQVNLVFSKMRLASKGSNAKKKSREITLPRLELLAMTVGARAANFVMKQLQGSVPHLRRMLLTDSACVLYWLRTNKPLSIFVENRIKEIKQEKDIVCHYVPTNQNPADIPTRGMDVSEISLVVEWSRVATTTTEFMAKMEYSIS